MILGSRSRCASSPSLAKTVALPWEVAWQCVKLEHQVQKTFVQGLGGKNKGLWPHFF